MTVVAVLGAGAGGLSCSVELTQAGHDVRLWNRNPRTLEKYGENRSVPYEGVLGEGTASLASVTTDLREALRGAEVVVVCLPALAHAALFTDLTDAACVVPILLNPGHTGGALRARATFLSRGVALPPIVEFSTLTYVARIRPEGGVRITCRARQVRVAALPGGESAVAIARELFPGVLEMPDVLATSLSNVNLALHPPGAILAAAWVEASGQEFTFYVDAMTPGVARVIVLLDGERRSVARRFGHDLPSLTEEMALIGTVAGDAVTGDVGVAIRGGEANRWIKAPDSLDHRYYQEDLPYALTPFIALADIGDVAVPTARALLTIGSGLLARDLVATGLSAEALGIADLGFNGLMELVRHRG